jgi:hypothetical protein
VDLRRVPALALAAVIVSCGGTSSPAGSAGSSNASGAAAVSSTAVSSATGAPAAPPTPAPTRAINARYTDETVGSGRVVVITFNGYAPGTQLILESIKDASGKTSAIGRTFTLGPDLRFSPGAFSPSGSYELVFTLAGTSEGRTTVTIGPDTSAVRPESSPTPAVLGFPFASPPAVTCAAGKLLAPSSLQVAVTDGVKTAELCDVFDVLARTARYLETTVGAGALTRTNVLIATPGSPALPAYGAGGCCTNYSPTDLYVVPGNEAWSFPPRPYTTLLAGRAYLVGSQYFHLWQTANGCRPWEGRRYEPGWFYAGTAEYFGVQLASLEGRVAAADLRVFQVAEALKSPVSLRGVEESGPVEVFQGTNKAFNLGYLATELLVNRYDWAGLRTLCTNLRPNVSRADAFARSFNGASLDDFYAEFDRWKANGFR